MKKTLVILLAVMFLMTSLFSGCGGAKQDQPAAGTQTEKEAPKAEAKAEGKPAEKKTTSFTFWTFVELHKQFYDDAVATWNKANPNDQINFKGDVYPYDEMHNKLQIALQSGTGAPDIVDIEMTKFPVFLKGDTALAPLNSVVEPMKDKLIMGRFENYAKDGKYYGIEYHIGATVAFYNKEILDKAGVKAEDIKTWADFTEKGKLVLEKTGKPMTTIETNNMWSFFPLINQQGSDYLNKDGSVQVDNPTNIATLQFLKDMVYKDKIAVLAPGGEHHAEAYYAFMNKGGAASVIMPLWYMGRFLEYMPDLKGKIVIRPMPAWKEGGFRSAGMGGTGTAVTNQCKNSDLAVKFLAASKLTKEGAIKVWTVLGFDPVFKDVYDDPALSAPNKYTDYFGTDIMATVKSVLNEINPINVGEKFTDCAMGVGRTAIFKALKEQSQTPEQALKTLSDEIRKK